MVHGDPHGLVSGLAEGQVDDDSIHAVLEQLVAPLQIASPQPSEVILHDLRRIPRSIRAISGNLTDRRPGDPPTDKLLEWLASGDWQHRIGYESTLPDGRTLRSTTIFFRGRSGQPVAALCFNTDVSAWREVHAALDRLMGGGPAPMAGPDRAEPAPDLPVKDTEHFPRSVDDLSSHLIRQAVERVGVPVESMRREQKVEVVADLRRHGFFLVKQSAEKAAAALGVSRFTIYNYLQEGQEDSPARDGTTA